MIPKGWKEDEVKSLITNLQAGVSVNSEDRTKNLGEVGILKVSSVTYGVFDPSAYKTVLPGEVTRLTLYPQQDRILVSRANTLQLVGASAYVDCDYPDIFLSDKLWMITTSGNTSARWLNYVLRSDLMRAKLSDQATGTSGSMKNISQDSFLSLRLLIPPLPEQRAIAAILSTWDEAITLTERLIAALRQRKQALMQLLLTGEVRFKEFEEDWEENEFSEILGLQIGGTPSRSVPDYWDREKTTQNRWLSIADLKSKWIRETTEYLSDLGVQHSNVKPLPAGTVVMSFKLTIGRTGILMYPSYTNEAICALIPKNNDKLLNGYLYHSLAVVDFSAELDQAVKGQTLNKAKLARLHMAIPPQSEQKQITTFLDLTDQELEIANQLLEQLRVEKRGLMQQLLTGAIRVRVDE